MDTISEQPAFYGYILGLHLGASPDPSNPNRNLYADFEYGGTLSRWIVPDIELFKILSDYLCRQAWSRKESDDYGYEKLWIEKTKERWVVTLP